MSINILKHNVSRKFIVLDLVLTGGVVALCVMAGFFMGFVGAIWTLMEQIK